ncbi:MAG TPA: hypothetical protein VMP11_13490 [Verrucomicrobiae bacterium]|nr:hypothetical protein [Verrucomicrobiae bacterium]
MKLALVTISAYLTVICACKALMGIDPGAPELKGALRCEIRVDTNTVMTGSRFPVSLTVENTGPLEAELPSPRSSEPGMYVGMFLLASQGTGTVQRLPIRSLALPDVLPLRQQRILENNPAEMWELLLKPSHASWISIPGYGKASFLVFVEIPQQGDGTGLFTAAEATYGLQCEIRYRMLDITSTEFMETNQWTSAEAIAKAKASGVFLLDPHHLWTGKMESNIVDLTITNQPNLSTTRPPK